MPHTPEQSAIRLTPEIESALASAQFEDIKDIFTQAALDQQLVVRDEMNPTILLETTLASAAPKRFAKTIVINGVNHILEADSEVALARSENDLLRATFSEPGATAQQTEQPRDAAGRFTFQTKPTLADPDLEAIRIAELELKFKRGELSPGEYLTQSGVIEQYLESQGISVHDLKTASETAYRTNWESATETFLARHPEWQGGEDAVRVIGETVFALGLQGKPDVESLEAAYAELQRTNGVPSNPALEASKEADTRYQREVSEATTLEEIRSANHRRLGVTGASGVFYHR